MNALLIRIKLLLLICITTSNVLVAKAKKSTSGHDGYEYKENTTFGDLVTATHKKLAANNPDKKEQPQSIAHLNTIDLISTLNTFSPTIEAVGVDFIKELLETSLQREFTFSDRSYVFYHGHPREFMLPQDLYKELHIIVLKQFLVNFYVLRIKDSHLTTLKTVGHFLKETRHISDYSDPIKTQLLSVTPALLSFSFVGYFLPSKSCGPINVLTFVQKVFTHFNCDKMYTKHLTQLTELHNLLAAYEERKTGVMLQIFITKKLVNETAYHCHAGGVKYYDNQTAESHPASQEIENFKQHPNSYDQYRLLMNETMIQPNNGVQMFRYCNETTPNMKLYKEKLAELVQKLCITKE